MLKYNTNICYFLRIYKSNEKKDRYGIATWEKICNFGVSKL